MTRKKNGSPFALLKGMETKDEIILNKQIYVKATPERLYGTWYNFENLPKILDFLDTVMVLDEINSRWSAFIGEEHERLVWDIEITDRLQNRLIEWHSGGNPDIFHRGRVIFTDHKDKGTLLQLQIYFFFPPRNDSGKQMLGAGFEERIEEDLRRFKQAMEADRFPEVKMGQESHPEGFPLSESSRRPFLNSDSIKKRPPEGTHNSSAPGV